MWDDGNAGSNILHWFANSFAYVFRSIRGQEACAMTRYELRPIYKNAGMADGFVKARAYCFGVVTFSVVFCVRVVVNKRWP